MGKPPTTDQELSARVAALEQRADATDAAIASLHADLDVTNADVSMLIDRTDALDDRVTALEADAGMPEAPPVISGGPILPPVRPDHTLPVPEPKPPEPPTTGRAVTILLDGASHLFTQEGGTDLGAYTDPQGRFTQHCIAARCDTLPDFTVMFRPDADGQREEVVFEFGRCFGNPTGSVLSAYSAVITCDGETLADINVPFHSYYSRWRWQSAVRPVTVSVASLVAARLVPPYDKTLVPGRRALTHTDGGPMASNGVETGMGTTGERDDIGIMTESQADYIMYEDAQGLTTVRAWGEASAACPWHMRDENTLAPIDFVNTYPNASCRGGGYGTPAMPAPDSYQTHWGADPTHEPTLCYLPFMLTGDPFFLEEVQFVTTWDKLCLLAPYGMDAWRTRGMAWHIRNIAYAVLATPAGGMPSWIKSKAYWQTYLDGALPLLQGICATPAPSCQAYFHDFAYVLSTTVSDTDDTGCIAGFQDEYVMGLFNLMSWTGFGPAWDALRDWKIQSNIARTNGTSGYNRSEACTFVRGERKDNINAPFLTTWAELWNWNYSGSSNASLIAIFAQADLTQTHLAPDYDYTITSSNAGNINWANRMGVAGLTASRDWLVPEMVGKWGPMRWAIS